MKFGLIIPSSNTTMEAEFWKMALGFASVHAARMRLQKITLDDLEEMEGQMLEAAVSLADAGVDVIGYGCTSGSLFKGKDHDREKERKITEKTGIPAVATARAVVEALNEFQIGRVCVAIPYIEEINDLEKNFLEQNGIEVFRIQGLNIMQNTEVGKKEPSVVFELAKEAYVPETQGIFISCTNFRTLDVISELEKELARSIDVLVVEAGYLKRRAGAQEIYVPALTVQIANTSEKIIKQLMLLAYFEREKKSVFHAALSIIKLKPGERREVMLKCLESIGFGTVSQLI